LEIIKLILGVIGGVSWHSSSEYYRQLNMRVAQHFGRRQSARIVLSSLNFADLLDWQKDNSNQQLCAAFLLEGQRLKAAGCDAFLIASHTLNWLGQLIEAQVGLSHICLYKAVFEQMKKLNLQTVGLVGTRYTMSESGYVKNYEEAGFTVVTPTEPLRTQVADIVYKELVRGIFRKESEESMLLCFQDLVARGAEAVVLGCTEIGLLVKKRSLHVRSGVGLQCIPLIDLIEVHVGACLSWMQEQPYLGK
jgi:aspartate racemase